MFIADNLSYFWNLVYSHDDKAFVCIIFVTMAFESYMSWLLAVIAWFSMPDVLQVRGLNRSMPTHNGDGELYMRPCQCLQIVQPRSPCLPFAQDIWFVGFVFISSNFNQCRATLQRFCIFWSNYWREQSLLFRGIVHHLQCWLRCAMRRGTQMGLVF